MVSIVNMDGELFLKPQSCKDYVQDVIMHFLYPKLAKVLNIYNVGFSGSPSLDKPVFVYWSTKKTAERNSIKFLHLINQLEKIMGLEPTVSYPVNTGTSKSSCPIVAEADVWWMKSPVALSAYLTFMRLCIAMRLDESFDDFIARITKNPGASTNYAIQRDCRYIELAKKKGHLAGLMEKSLPCLNRDGYIDYALSGHDRGFSGYKLKLDERFPLTKDELFSYLRTVHGKGII